MGELKHYGVKGMKWGVRKTHAEYRERSTIRKHGNVFGENRKTVKEERDKAIREEGKLKRLREDVVNKPNFSEKRFDKLRKYERKLIDEWKSKDVDAWRKDANIKKLSEQGRKYAEDVLYGRVGYTIDTVLY